MERTTISKLMAAHLPSQDDQNLQAAWRMIRRQLAGHSEAGEAKTILQFLRGEKIDGRIIEGYGFQELHLEFWVDPTRQTVLVRFLGEEAICNTKALAEQLEKVIELYESQNKAG
jgi:hypothetical protein